MSSKENKPIDFYSLEKLEKKIISFSNKVSDAINLAIVFPNIYKIGIASLGYQTAWKLLYEDKFIHVSRWFTDVAQKSKDLDYIGFSFSWELDYKNIFSILEKNSIPILSKDREEDDPIIFSGGQVSDANPEPFADNFDFFLLGDLEVIIPILTEKMYEIKSMSRKRKLEELASLDCVYVPGLNTKKQKRQISNNTLSYSSILTEESFWPSTFLVEVVRSCPELCKFCLASFGSLPFRTPDIKNNLIPIIDQGLKFTNKFGLLGASVTQHPDFEELFDYLLFINSKSKLRVQIASVRADSISEKTASSLFTFGNKSLTIAVETGSDRLREIINKKVSSETIKKTISTIYSTGFNSVKLYGMIGLPHEEEEDILQTINFLKEIKLSHKGKNLIWGCSTFVPKAKTPFFKYGMDKNAPKKIKLLSKELHKLGVEFRVESYEWSLIQGLISRGDKKINSILYHAYKYGSTLGSFKKAMKESKDIDCNNYIFANWSYNQEKEK